MVRVARAQVPRLNAPAIGVATKPMPHHALGAGGRGQQLARGTVRLSPDSAAVALA
jgi:hypothetical protein